MRCLSCTAWRVRWLSPPVSRSPRPAVLSILSSLRHGGELWPATHPHRRSWSFLLALYRTSEHNDLDHFVVKCFKRLVFYLEHRQYPVPDCNPHAHTLSQIQYRYHLVVTLSIAAALSLSSRGSRHGVNPILYSYRHKALLSPRIIHHYRSFPVTLIGSSSHAVFSRTTTSTRSNPVPPNRPLA
jgi:hypothetical protein